MTCSSGQNSKPLPSLTVRISLRDVASTPSTLPISIPLTSVQAPTKEKTKEKNKDEGFQTRNTYSPISRPNSTSSLSSAPAVKSPSPRSTPYNTSVQANSPQKSSENHSSDSKDSSNKSSQLPKIPPLTLYTNYSQLAVLGGTLQAYRTPIHKDMDLTGDGLSRKSPQIQNSSSPGHHSHKNKEEKEKKKSKRKRCNQSPGYIPHKKPTPAESPNSTYESPISITSVVSNANQPLAISAISSPETSGKSTPVTGSDLGNPPRADTLKEQLTALQGGNKAGSWKEARH